MSFQKVRRVEDSLLPCKGSEPRTNNSGLTVEKERRARLCLHRSIPHQCKMGLWIPPSLLGISIKSREGSPRKCLKWLESFLTIWKWKSAVTNSSPATKPLPPRLCIALCSFPAPLLRLQTVGSGNSEAAGLRTPAPHEWNATAAGTVPSPCPCPAWEGLIESWRGKGLIVSRGRTLKEAAATPANKARFNPSIDLNWLQNRPLTASPV